MQSRHHPAPLALAASILICAILATAASATTQAVKISAPPGHEGDSAYGQWYTDNFGGYSTGHMLYGDGSLRGKKRTILGVDYRLRHWFSYQPGNSPYNGLGRTWTRVTLTMAHTDITKFSRTATRNVIGSATKVYDAKTSWPTVTSPIPKSSPNDPNVFVVNPKWGTHVSFPFSSNFVYDGTTDLLFWYEFAGGTLLNNVAWGAAHRPYPLDGLRSDPMRNLTSNGHRLPGPNWPACWDTGLQESRAIATLGANLYGDQFPTTTLRGKIQLLTGTLGTAPSAPIIGALTLGGFDTGVAIGARCNKLHVHMPGLIALGVGTTNNTANPGPLQPLITKSALPYSDAFAGVDLYFQAAWTDSKLGVFSLTSAEKLTLPRKPQALKKISAQLYTRSGKFNPSTDDHLQHLPLLTVQ